MSEEINLPELPAHRPHQNLMSVPSGLRRCAEFYAEAYASEYGRQCAEAARKEEWEDASRYRWLRDNCGVDLRTALGVGDFESFDAFIDRARSKT